LQITNYTNGFSQVSVQCMVSILRQTKPCIRHPKPSDFNGQSINGSPVLTCGSCHGIHPVFLHTQVTQGPTFHMRSIKKNDFSHFAMKPPPAHEASIFQLLQSATSYVKRRTSGLCSSASVCEAITHLSGAAWPRLEESSGAWPPGQPSRRLSGIYFSQSSFWRYFSITSQP